MRESGCYVSGCGMEAGMLENAKERERLTQGVDVSKYQGEIDWEKVKASGIDFVIVRASYGWSAGQTDPTFARNAAGAQAAGLAVGAYHYSYAKTVEEARKEAELFYHTIRDKKLDMPVYLDLEDPGQAGLGKAALTEIAAAFCSYLEERKYFVGIYANLNWLENKLDLDRLPYTVWLARWAAAPGYGGSFGLWQFSSKGQVDGIDGLVDRDACYQDFPTLIRRAGLNGFGEGEGGETGDAGGGESGGEVNIIVHCRCRGWTREITGQRRGNTIYAPARQLGEALGCQVVWQDGQVFVYG